MMPSMMQQNKSQIYEKIEASIYASISFKKFMAGEKMKKTWFNKRFFEKSILVLPTILIYTLVIAYPLLNMCYTSFFDWNGIPSTPYVFVGLENYKKFFCDIIAMTSLKNVVIIMLVSVFGVIPIAFFLATVISKKFFARRVVKAVYFLPVIINKVAIGLMFVFILFPKTGPFAKILELFGITGNINILGNMNTSIWACAFVIVWCNIGLHMILFSAAMTAIPSDIYESAEIDGISSFQRLRYITVPLLRGTINMSAVLLLTNAFRVFDLIAALTDGGPGFSSQVLTTLIYKNAFYYGEYGYADAIGVMTVLFCVVVMLIANKILPTSKID